MFKNQSHHPKIFLLALLLITPFSAQTKPDGFIWTQDEQFVRLVGQELSPNKNQQTAPTAIKLIPNQHPQDVSTETLINVLQHIIIEDMQTSRFLIAGKRQVVSAPLLGPTKSKRFAKALQKAFKQAAPNQDIVFRIHGGKQTLGGVLTTTTVNTGRAFWLNSKLNIILDTVNERHNTKWVYGHRVADTTVRSFGSRSQTVDNFSVNFSPVAGIEQAIDSTGQVRPDWLIIDPNQLQELAQEQRNIKQVEQVARDTSHSTRSKKTANSMGHTKSIHEQLTELKKLYASGLISEALYNSKTKEIIDAHY